MWQGLEGLFFLVTQPNPCLLTASFTFQDLVDSDVSHKLLHRIILQVAIAPMHLESLVTNLWRQHCC